MCETPWLGRALTGQCDKAAREDPLEEQEVLVDVFVIVLVLHLTAALKTNMSGLLCFQTGHL